MAVLLPAPEVREGAGAPGRRAVKLRMVEASFGASTVSLKRVSQ
jgi:hypothetical protein